MPRAPVLPLWAESSDYGYHFASSQEPQPPQLVSPLFEGVTGLGRTTLTEGQTQIVEDQHYVESAVAPSWRAQPTTVEVTSTLDPQHHEFIAGFHTVQMTNEAAARDRRAARRANLEPENGLFLPTSYRPSGRCRRSLHVRWR